MAKVLNFIQFLACVGFLTGCGSSKTVRITYSVPGGLDPDLIVIIEVDPTLTNYKQNLGPVDSGEGLVFFHSSNANLRKCAVAQGFIDLAINTSFLSSAEQADGSLGCGSLGTFFSTEIFAGTSLDIAKPLEGAQGFSVGDVTNGFVFVLFFYNQEDSSEPNRCFQIFAAEVRNKQLVDTSGTPLDSTTISLQAVTNTGGLPSACFSYA